MKTLRATLLLVAVVMLTSITGWRFRSAYYDEPLYPSASHTSTVKLSNYFSALKGTRADTDVYEYQGGDSGGTVLVLGGTHCDEPASFIAAYLVVEQLRMERGRVLVVPRTNRSALTHTTPGEAFPATFAINGPHGSREFRMGSRYTNPLDQWPDPEVFVHFPSGQELSGADCRNLNRCYPGKADGTFTQRIAFALTEMIKRERVDLVVDLHEASLEYPVINAIVAHERAMDCAALAVLELQMEGLEFALEPSPTNFRGLSHRELGDHTPVFATLMESANVIQGRLRGKTNSGLIVDGLDSMYIQASEIELTRVPYDSSGIPLSVRVGRHLAGFQKLVTSFNQLNSDRQVLIGGLPTFRELQDHGVGGYLSPSAAK